MKADLPLPSADAQAASNALLELIHHEITRQNGWISFADYWTLALYTPRLGYYAGGSVKFGSDAEGGDFVTAPELTPLFGQALARQVAQITRASAPMVLEAGAGSGKLAADLLLALEALGALPERYLILELSGELRARQQATLAQLAPALAERVTWQDALPDHFSGCVVGNEVLDAMPVHRLRWCEGQLREIGVGLNNAGQLSWIERPANEALVEAALALDGGPDLNDSSTTDYTSELGLAAQAWTAEWGHRLVQGGVILLDYGLPRHEFYHPQRNGGTIRCHYRHRTHNDPFWWPGLSDITAHVEFTAIAEAGYNAGLDVLGYTHQASFLMNCGVAELLAERQRQEGPGGAVKATGALNLLISPNEMGELFKVIALGKGLGEPLIGFSRNDRTHTL
ncbi:MAG: class I SAM-dependent methyltransferase [Zoogloea sp.]|uniref:class I SAM-dependent methyltransferase n=1 Tax=Zoogloea sp. TaxID=49181 RepID=UPI003F2B7616